MSKRIIISGGGTGGHIFPAIAIANALRAIDAGIEILFVGAEGRMEAEKVPAAGYSIRLLPIMGMSRSLFSKKNLQLPGKLYKSLARARAIINDFAPDVVVGVGGYASAPVLWVAQNKGIPTLIQEQNSYAGLTNKILGRRAKKVCVAYDNMSRFFNPRKIIFTGNPVRQDLEHIEGLRKEALAYFGLVPNKKTILVIGGSLGAKVLNLSILEHIDQIIGHNQVQIIWQIGAIYKAEMEEKLKSHNCHNIMVMDFIHRMDYAFAAADLVVSRAGAGTISELCVVGKPCILIPSPNVTEDHQTYNAMSLVRKDAAILVPDSEAITSLVPIALQVVESEERLASLSENIGKLAVLDAAKVIAHEVLRLAK